MLASRVSPVVCTSIGTLMTDRRMGPFLFLNPDEGDKYRPSGVVNFWVHIVVYVDLLLRFFFLTCKIRFAATDKRTI